MARGLTNKQKAQAFNDSGSGPLKTAIELSLEEASRHKLLTAAQEIQIAKAMDLAREKAVRCLIGSLHSKLMIVNLLDRLNNGEGRFDAIIGLPYDTDKNKAASRKILAANLGTLRALVKKERDLLAKRLSKKEKVKLDLSKERINLKRINGKFLTLVKECKLKNKRVFSLAADLTRAARYVSLIEQRRDDLKKRRGCARQKRNQDMIESLERSVKSTLELKCYQLTLQNLSPEIELKRSQALQKVLACEKERRQLFESRRRILANKSEFDTDEAHQEEIRIIEVKLAGLEQKFGITLETKKLTRKDELAASRHALKVAYGNLGESGNRALERLKLYEDSLKVYLEARDNLTKPNGRLVISIAKRYRNRGVDFEDLIAAGMEGLIVSAELYEHHRGNKFSTYATWWIKQKVRAAVKAHRKRPGVRDDHEQQLRKVKDRLCQDLGRNPNREEVLQAWMKARSCNTQRRAGTSKEGAYEQDVAALERGAANEASLEIRPGARGSEEVVQRYVASSQKAVIDELMEAEQNKAQIDLAARALELLDKREAKILMMRFGIGEPVQTLQQVGDLLGITRERVRQIELRAIQKAKVILGGTDKNVEVVGGIPASPKKRKKKGAAKVTQVHTTSSPDSTTSAQSPPSTESSEVPSSKS